MRWQRAAAATLWLALACAGAAPTPTVVHTAEVDLSGLTAPTVDGARMEALKRSPLWQVTRERDGSLAARLRTASGLDGAHRFVNEWLAAGTPDGWSLEGDGRWRGPDVVDLSITVHDTQPEGDVVTLGGIAELPIQANYATELDGNAASVLVVSLGGGLWLSVREQGAAPARQATRDAVAVALRAIEEAAPLDTPGALARELHADFFAAVGAPPATLRFKGLQERDALGVVLVADADHRYDGVQVRVFEPDICGGECTRDFRQAQKAELLGSPPAGDWVLALVPDNAVFLSGEHDQKHGVFTGSASFDAEIRWTDADGARLHSYQGPFWGWQR